MLDKGLKILNLALVAAAVFLGVGIFYETVEYKLDTAVMSVPSAKDNPAQKPSRAGGGFVSTSSAGFSEYDVIVERNLFDARTKEKKEKEIKASQIEDLEKTGLNLRLWGTIAGPEGKSYAVIEKKSSRQQQLYRPGDTVEGARIKVILRKRVVLSVNGKDEVLEMEDLVEHADMSSGRSREMGRGSEMIGESGGSETTIEIEREQISSAMQNVSNLMRQVRIRPYFEDGNPGGVMLSSIRSGSIFEEMGLESGDIIKGVNGREIRSMDDAMQFYENLKSAGEINLQLQRNGSQRNIRYRIE
ncbi:MAG: PDZ domain-containing protein [Desulfobacteraceae bacterium]|nr:PDZ domain-containing protein [Desulfobacteraceae bacterium]MCF8094220.1 PDZ domain-containing protein [Desulfobacteraceae bacterium]